MVGSEEVITSLEGPLMPFCCLWPSLTCAFPCWGNQMNILRVTPHSKKGIVNTYMSFAPGG